MAANVADQCRAMGLSVGDTIEGREECSGGAYWQESRLTLLWIGSRVAVWRVTERGVTRPEWSEPRESADWTLDCRQWVKVGVTNCWHCSKSYPVTDGRCPHCGATNANIDPDKALAESLFPARPMYGQSIAEILSEGKS